jgi:hypothetical protein
MHKLLTALSLSLTFLGELMIAPELLGKEKLAALLEKLSRLTVRKIGARIAIIRLKSTARKKQLHRLTGQDVVQYFLFAVMAFGVAPWGLYSLFVGYPSMYRSIHQQFTTGPAYEMWYILSPTLATTCCPVIPLLFAVLMVLSFSSIAYVLHPEMRTRLWKCFREQLGLRQEVARMATWAVGLCICSPILFVKEVLYTPVGLLLIVRDSLLIGTYGLVKLAHRIILDEGSKLRSTVLTVGVVAFIVGNVLQILLAIFTQ